MLFRTSTIDRSQTMWTMQSNSNRPKTKTSQAIRFNLSQIWSWHERFSYQRWISKQTRVIFRTRFRIQHWKYCHMYLQSQQNVTTPCRQHVVRSVKYEHSISPRADIGNFPVCWASDRCLSLAGSSVHGYAATSLRRRAMILMVAINAFELVVKMVLNIRLESQNPYNP